MACYKKQDQRIGGKSAGAFGVESIEKSFAPNLALSFDVVLRSNHDWIRGLTKKRIGWHWNNAELWLLHDC